MHSPSELKKSKSEEMVFKLYHNKGSSLHKDTGAHTMRDLSAIKKCPVNLLLTAQCNGQERKQWDGTPVEHTEILKAEVKKEPGVDFNSSPSDRVLMSFSYSHNSTLPVQLQRHLPDQTVTEETVTQSLKRSIEQTAHIHPMPKKRKSQELLYHNKGSSPHKDTGAHPMTDLSAIKEGPASPLLTAQCNGQERKQWDGTPVEQKEMVKAEVKKESDFDFNLSLSDRVLMSFSYCQNSTLSVQLQHHLADQTIARPGSNFSNSLDDKTRINSKSVPSSGEQSTEVTKKNASRKSPKKPTFSLRQWRNIAPKESKSYTVTPATQKGHKHISVLTSFTHGHNSGMPAQLQHHLPDQTISRPDSNFSNSSNDKTRSHSKSVPFSTEATPKTASRKSPKKTTFSLRPLRKKNITNGTHAGWDEENIAQHGQIQTKESKSDTDSPASQNEPEHICELSCTQCDKPFSRISTLTRHIREIHGLKKKRFMCDVCPKSFARLSRLRGHMTSRHHQETKPFVCEKCGKGFCSAQQLRTHAFTHIGLKPYKCKECPAGFTRSDYLKKHQLMHSGQKPYLCNVCGKGFSRKSNLNVHIKWHVRESGKEN